MQPIYDIARIGPRSDATPATFAYRIMIFALAAWWALLEGHAHAFLRQRFDRCGYMQCGNGRASSVQYFECGPQKPGSVGKFLIVWGRVCHITTPRCNDRAPSQAEPDLVDHGFNEVIVSLGVVRTPWLTLR